MTAGFPLKQFAPPPSRKRLFKNNRKISITIDFAPPPEKIPGRKADSEAGCIFENFTPKRGNSFKILVAGTRNDGVFRVKLGYDTIKRHFTSLVLELLTHKPAASF